MLVTRTVFVKTEASAEDWVEARRKTRKALAEMTPEEDAAITADALLDSDNPPIEDDACLMPLDRPFDRIEGEQTNVRVDRETVERFRRAGDDWEERINAILREAAPAE
ncbi:BrnA antitoxin family protein [Jiella endophytica]|nr:BrnA antitoxin family protein [Jiella endophytica]